MTLGCFINLYEKTAYANNGEFTEISTYQQGIKIGYLKLMCFNDLHLFVSDACIQGYKLHSHIKVIQAYGWSIMGF